MNFTISEMDDFIENEHVEDVGSVYENGQFIPSTSRVPPPRITTMAHKNRGSLTQTIMQPPAPRKVTYDDILSSLNMKVVNGKLEIVRNIAVENIKTNNFPAQQQYEQQPMRQEPMRQQPMRQQPMRQQPMRQQQQQPYSQQQFQESQQQIPLTKEQHKQLAIANYMKQQQQLQRIKQIKSKKMKFF
uniref:Uncharacterized protein n=1 Tax=viral metagenome TaxID=1070528 RepID=A0A6C0B193_9ZZZZ